MFHVRFYSALSKMAPYSLREGCANDSAPFDSAPFDSAQGFKAAAPYSLREGYANDSAPFDSAPLCSPLRLRSGGG